MRLRLRPPGAPASLPANFGEACIATMKTRMDRQGSRRSRGLPLNYAMIRTGARVFSLSSFGSFGGAGRGEEAVLSQRPYFTGRGTEVLIRTACSRLFVSFVCFCKICVHPGPSVVFLFAFALGCGSAALGPFVVLACSDMAQGYALALRAKNQQNPSHKSHAYSLLPR